MRATVVIFKNGACRSFESHTQALSVAAEYLMGDVSHLSITDKNYLRVQCCKALHKRFDQDIFLPLVHFDLTTCTLENVEPVRFQTVA